MDNLRICCSSERRGYGNALYIAHNNGKVSVYAHLERFSEKIPGLQSRIDSEKQKKGYYPGDIFLDIPVTKGQIVAYSGETGVGLPHLHFELRNKNGESVNPLINGMIQEDTSPPEIISLVMEPMNTGDLIDGEPFPRKIKFDISTEDGFTSSETPVTSGEFFLKLEAYDTIGATNRCGIKTLKAKFNNAPFFSSSMDDISYDSYKEIGLFFDMANSSFNPTRFFHKLFREPGLTAAVIRQAAPAYWMKPVTQGTQSRLLFEAGDAAGNVSKAIMNLVQDLVPSIIKTSVNSGGTGGEREFVIIANVPGGHNSSAPSSQYIGLEISDDLGTTWELLEKWTESRGNKYGGSGLSSQEFSFVSTLPSNANTANILYRTRIFDGQLFSSYVTFPDTELAPEMLKNGIITAGNYRFNIHYYRNYIVFELDPKNSFVYPDPRLILEFTDRDTVALPYTQKTYGHFIYAYSTDSSKSGLVKVRCDQGDAGKPGQVTIGNLVLTPVLPESKQTLTFKDYMLVFEPGSVYSKCHIYARTRSDLGSRELKMFGQPCEFMPGEIPFKKPQTLIVDLTDLVSPKTVDASKLGIYRYYDNFDVWYFQDSLVSADRTRVSAEISNPAVYAVLLDNVKPEILETYPSQSKPVSGKKLVITAQVKDIGSGIDYRGITATLDKRSIPMDFDPDRDKIFSLESYNLVKGQHQLTLTVKDMAGNSSNKKIISFTVY